MKHLVTGSKGFLGSHLMRALGEDAVGVDLPECDVTWSNEDESGGHVAPSWQIYTHKPETVWHLAALNDATQTFYDRPWDVLNTQIRGTLNVIDACRANGVKTLVLFSSSEVYQTPPVIPTPEDVPLVVPDLTNPRYSYGGGKIAAELLAWHSAIPSVVVLRPHNVYSEDQRRGHVIPDLIAAMAEALAEHPAEHDPSLDSHRQGWPVIPKFTIKDAGATRSFIHVSDFTSACLKIVGHVEARAGAVREVYHVGTQEQVSVASLAGKIADLMKKRFRWKSAPGLPGGTPNRCPDVTKLRALGWEPRVTLDEGLRRTVEAWRERVTE